MTDSSVVLISVITSLFELHVRCKRFILLVQTKKVDAMSYGSSILHLEWWIYTSIPTWIHSRLSSTNKSSEFKDIIWCTSLMIMKTIPIHTRIVVNWTMKSGIPLWVWKKVNGNWDNNMTRISQWRKLHSWYPGVLDHTQLYQMSQINGFIHATPHANLLPQLILEK